MPKPHHRERLATINHPQRTASSHTNLDKIGTWSDGVGKNGHYTSEARDVLLCAVTNVQVPHLKEIVSHADPSAFVIVSPTEDVRGWGFSPFETPS
jgi:uncharacterized membrane-anchored protein YitT (DUF2179 family)